MELDANDCCVLNGGSGAWAFEPLAEQLSQAVGIPVSASPRRFNYLLHLEAMDDDFDGRVFIPLASIRIAADKRLMAATFARHALPTPQTVLLESFDQVRHFIAQDPLSPWCLKYPTGCGANGHRLIDHDSVEPPNWPRPFVVQEFVRLERPEVYRL